MNKCNRCKYSFNPYYLIKSEKCKAHSYCFKCRSILKSKTEEVEDCESCNKHYSKKGRNFFRNHCKYCNSKSEILVQFCRDHKICRSCIYNFFPSEQAHPEINCRYCQIIITKFCRNCFIYLDENEKFYKEPCDVHIYCQECVRNYKIKNNCRMCTTFNVMKENNLVIIPKKEHEDIKLKATQSVNFSKENKKFLEINQSDSKSLDTRKYPSNQEFIINSNKCEGCSSLDPILLECYHKYCFNCILNRFRQDFMFFMQLIFEKRFDEISNEGFCIRCPCSYADCFLKFIFPFSKEYVMSEILGFGGNTEYFIDCFGSYFDGNRMTFMVCINCDNVVGISEQSGQCCYCKPTMSA